MGIIKNHLAQMKADHPEEYKRLMKGYESEKEFIREALGLSEKALTYYNQTKKRGIINGN